MPRKKSPGRRLSLRKLAAIAGVSLGALVLVVAAIILLFGNAILNRYGKEKAERAFAEAYPGSALQIGKLNYSIGANRLVAQSVSFSSAKTTLKVDRISLTGVRWARLLRGTAAPADVLAKAGFEATKFEVEFPQARYGIRCARLQASVPNADLIAEGTELQALVGDDAFFAGLDFRTTRFHVLVPECRVSGLAYGELLQGTSVRAESVHFMRPLFEALVAREKPPKTFVKNRPMVSEALASIRQPLQIGRLDITDGRVHYGERLAVGAAPGVLTFGAVSFSAEGIANRGGAKAVIRLQAQGNLMDAGTIKVLMSIPIIAPNLALHYSGSLGAMDLSRLNAFLDVTEHTRIKSGTVQSVTFEIDVIAGRALGLVHAKYHDLMIAVLDKQTGAEKGFASFMANLLKIRNSNATKTSGSIKEGRVDYTRNPSDSFIGFVWSALRNGVFEIISH